MSIQDEDLRRVLQELRGEDTANCDKRHLSKDEAARYTREMEKLCPTVESLLAATKEDIDLIHEREKERGIVIIGGIGIGRQIALDVRNMSTRDRLNVPITNKLDNPFSKGRGGKSIILSVALALATVSSSLYKETLAVSHSFESRSSKGSRRRNKQNKYRGPYG